MSNGNSGVGWLVTLAVSLLLAGILGGVSVWANDGRQDDSIEQIEETVDRHEAELKDKTKALLNLTRDIESIEGSMLRMAKAFEKVSERQ